MQILTLAIDPEYHLDVHTRRHNMHGPTNTIVMERYTKPDTKYLLRANVTGLILISAEHVLFC